MSVEIARANPRSEEEDPHRPLPSVTMPLLKDQRRAARSRQVVAAAAAAALLAVGAVAVLWLGLSSPAENAAPRRRSAAPPPALTAFAGGPVEPGQDTAALASPPVAPDRTVRAFGRSRSFREALVKAGVTREECAALEQALEGTLDFRRCGPDDKLVLEHDENGHLTLFEYRRSGAVTFSRATRNADRTWQADQVKLPTEVRRLVRGGVLRRSLGEAVEAAGLGRSLVGVFVEVFSTRADFQRDARTGDSFRIIVDEERVSGSFRRWGRVHALEYSGQQTGTLKAFWFAPKNRGGDYYDESGRTVQGGWLRTPLRYDRISSKYDPRRVHPILKRVVPHNGVDYAASTGTPVWAAADGRVTFAGRKGANGNLVAIRHEGRFDSYYAHLSRIERGIKRGVRVQQRELIGYVGSTGRSTGPHLHFGLKRRGRFVDPISELNGPGRVMPARLLPRYRRHVTRIQQELATLAVAPRPAASAPPSTSADPVDLPMD